MSSTGPTSIAPGPRSFLPATLALLWCSTAHAASGPDLKAALDDLFQLVFLGCVFLALDLVLVLLSAITLVRGRSAVTLFVLGAGNVLAAAGFVDFAVRFHSAIPLFVAGALQLAFALFTLHRGRRIWLSRREPLAAEGLSNHSESSLTSESR